MSKAKKRTLRVGNDDPSDVISYRASDELHEEVRAVASDAKRAGASPGEVAAVARSLHDGSPDFASVRSTREEGNAARAKQREAIQAIEARFAESGSPDDAAELELAEAVFKRVDAHWRVKENQAKRAWQRACERQKREQDAAEDLALLKSLAEG